MVGGAMGIYTMIMHVFKIQTYAFRHREKLTIHEQEHIFVEMLASRVCHHGSHFSYMITKRAVVVQPIIKEIRKIVSTQRNVFEKTLNSGETHWARWRGYVSVN